MIGKRLSLDSVNRAVAKLVKDKKVGERKGFYFLRNRSSIVSTRARRTDYSQSKLKRARFYAKLLGLIPTLKLVVVSGALAMQNSTKNDDIDLAVVSSPRTVWTTRFLCNLILYFLKRDPQSKKVSNRACLNVFIDGSDLKIKDQNLYIAHEICQMLPLLDRQQTYSHVAPVNANTNIKRSLSVYSRFMRSNSWVGKYLPNWTPLAVNGKWKIVNRKSGLRIYSPFTINYSPIETLLKKFQLWYMAKRISTERIGEHQLFFHPKNTQNLVLNEYKKRLKRLKIPASN